MAKYGLKSDEKINRVNGNDTIDEKTRNSGPFEVLISL